MKKSILKISLMLLSIGMVTFTSCKKDAENNVINQDASGITTMDKLVVSPDFNFKTTNDVSFTIKAEDNQGGPLTGVRVDILSDFVDNGGTYITSGMVNANGVLQFSRALPSYMNEVVVATKFLGLPNEQKVAVLNGIVSCTLGGKINKNKTPLLTPHSSIAKVKFLCTGYSNDGYPNNIMGTDLISNSLLNDLNTTLPEQRSVPVYHPEYIQNTPTDTKVNELCDVYVTFVSEGASYMNTLGFYTYNINNPPTSASQIDTMKIIFPNCSLPGSGGSLSTGSKVFIGRYPANTGIGWVCIANGWSSPNVNTGYGIKYSNPNFNSEATAAKRRHNVLFHDAVRNIYVIGFEDLNRDSGSDEDFNDLLFYVTSNPVTGIDNTNIPPIVSGPTDTDGDGIADNSDDYPTDPTKAFNTYFPSKNVTGTLAFEDLWPGKGDYDMNDVVVDYNFNQIENAQHKVVEIQAKLIVRATGASYQNGFGFQLPILPSAVTSVAGYRLTENYINVGANGLENNQAKAVVIAFDNAYKHFTNISGVNPNGFAGINTSIGGTHGTPDTINLVIKLATAVDASVLGTPPYNPFIISDKRRGYEIHLPNMVPTSLMNVALFGTGDDNSIPAQGRYFKTKSNLPWAVNFATRFDYPIEKAPIISAYLKFASWSLSNGNSYTDWYSNKAAGYRDNTKIYH